MNTTDFTERYNPERKCYAVYTHPTEGTIERGLILDGLHYSLSNVPYVHLDSFYTEVKLSDITDIIVTSSTYIRGK